MAELKPVARDNDPRVGEIHDRRGEAVCGRQLLQSRLGCLLLLVLLLVQCPAGASICRCQSQCCCQWVRQG